MYQEFSGPPFTIERVFCEICIYYPDLIFRKPLLTDPYNSWASQSIFSQKSKWLSWWFFVWILMCKQFFHFTKFTFLSVDHQIFESIAEFIIEDFVILFADIDEIAFKLLFVPKVKQGLLLISGDNLLDILGTICLRKFLRVQHNDLSLIYDLINVIPPNFPHICLLLNI